MVRHSVILITMLAILVPAIPAHAQQAGKVYRIGWLTVSRINPHFRQGMRELGYVEGKNLIIELRKRIRPETYLTLAKELVGLEVDLILTVGVSATRAARQATSTIPIVMGNSSADPVREGLIDSLARPGGNVTGVFDLLPDLAGKRVELLKEMFPKLTRVVHLSPALTPVGPAHLKPTVAAARALGVQVQALTAKNPDDLERAFRAAAEGGAQAVIVVGVGFFIPHRPRLVELAARYRLPTMHTHKGWVPLGGLISYTTDSRMRYRRAAQYVDKIFKGAKPANLPVEQPTKYLLEVNLKTAKALGLAIPPSILLRTTDVTE